MKYEIHNPQKVKESLLPKGHRFLYKHEIFTRELRNYKIVAANISGTGWNSACYKGESFNITYCTILTEKELAWASLTEEKKAIFKLLGLKFTNFLQI